MGSIESFPGHYLLLLSTPCEVPARLMVSAMLDVIKFSSSAVIDRVGRVPGILILILLGLICIERDWDRLICPVNPFMPVAAKKRLTTLVISPNKSDIQKIFEKEFFIRI